VLVSLQFGSVTMAMASQAALKVSPPSTPSAVALSHDNRPIVDVIFKHLDDSEKEQSARASSYKYMKSLTCSAGERDALTKAMIERYLTVEQKLGTKKALWEGRGLTKLRNTLKFRREMEVDDLRICFDKGKETSKLHTTIRERLEERFASGSSVIQGYSKEGRALFLNFPRLETKWEAEYYIKGNIYMLERALACTERKTKGVKTKVVMFFDYNQYAMKNSPPPALIRGLLRDLRDHWPERLEHVVLVDTPIFFRAFWAIVKHFIDPVTKDLVQFVTGEEQKSWLRELVAADQAMSFMFEGGQETAEVDMKRFFYDVPFDQAYGE